MSNKLKRDFYLQEDVVSIARQALGKVIVTRINGVITSGIITETEAYEGVTDKASHAYGGRRTERTEVMYKEGGVAYVYLCYGMHYLFNLVTNVKDVPHAVLVRAIKPLSGAEEILKRRNAKQIKPSLFNGPGKLTKALGIDASFNSLSLQSERLHLMDEGIRISPNSINVGKRIGIDYAEEHAELPYRFWIDL